jgi:hypothetical protein
VPASALDCSGTRKSKIGACTVKRLMELDVDDIVVAGGENHR